MKITKTVLGIFLTTFLIGLVFVSSTKRKVVEPILLTNTIADPKPKAPLDSKIDREIEKKFFDWQEEDETKFRIKLLEAGEGFHGDEIKAKSGEVWLGLFKENDKYFLRSTKIKVRPGYDAVIDEAGEKTGKDVVVKGKNQPLFLVKNAGMLKEGEIKTIFSPQSSDDGESLQNGFVADYIFNGNNYTLRVDGEENSSKLILESENTKQVLFFVDAVGDSIWRLNWVGDLDGDGKLDVYADLPVFYNFSQRRLFLSSQAENGKLVKQVAMFHTSGC